MPNSFCLTPCGPCVTHATILQGAHASSMSPCSACSATQMTQACSATQMTQACSATQMTQACSATQDDTSLFRKPR